MRKPVSIVGLLWQARFRISNRWCDVLAVLSGYCNHSPWTPHPSGGYSHWRCAKQRRHAGPHRSRNYVWSESGHASYRPVHNGTWPSQPRDRHATLTMRQVRQRERWVQQHLAYRGNQISVEV